MKLHKFTQNDKNFPLESYNRKKQRNRHFSSCSSPNPSLSPESHEDEADQPLASEGKISEKQDQSRGFSLADIRIFQDPNQSRGRSTPGRVPSLDLAPLWPVQVKLAVNQPGDKYEQEADRIAEQVMRMPERRIVSRSEMAGSLLMMRSCPKCKEKAIERQDEEERLQMKPVSGASPQQSAAQATSSSVPSIVHDVLRTSGQPLDGATRAFMEPRFRHDFSQVRIHTDRKAAESAHAVNARAYTAGHHIVIAERQHMPSSTSENRLLAHELAHVVQQGQSKGAVQATIRTQQEMTSYRIQRDLASDIRKESGRPASERTPGLLGQLETTARTEADAAFQKTIGGTQLAVGVTGRATQIINHVSLELSRLESARARGYQQAVSAIIGSLTMSNDQASAFWRAFAGNTLWALSGLVPLLGPVFGGARIAGLTAGAGGVLNASVVRNFLNTEGRTLASTLVGLVGAETAQFSSGVPSSAPNLPATMQVIQTKFTDINTRIMTHYRSEAFALTLNFLNAFPSFLNPGNQAPMNPNWVENFVKGCVMETLLDDLNKEGMLDQSNHTIDTGRAQQLAKVDLTNNLADEWFSNQAVSIGLGARAGVLQIELADQFPDTKMFRIVGGEIVGKGADVELLRQSLANRELKSIDVPKVIRMNGNMGLGMMPCYWHIKVDVSPQRVTYNGHPTQGIPWLAAFHLGLRDLESDDPRNTVANQTAGAQTVWEQVKNLKIDTIGNTLGYN